MNEIKKLKPGHVIHTMMAEHDMILGFLDELEMVNKDIQKMESYNKKENSFKKLNHIAQHLLDAEPHHKREEEVLFPQLEKNGVFAPPQVMRMEHEVLREKKKELKTLFQSINNIDFNNFKKRLNSVVGFIVSNLKEHISKENNVLYPMALETIKEEKLWKNMKDECDKIGYCCFTPKV